MSIREKENQEKNGRGKNRREPKIVKYITSEYTGEQVPLYDIYPYGLYPGIRTTPFMDDTKYEFMEKTVPKR